MSAQPLPAPEPRAWSRALIVVLLAGALVLLLSFGIRSTFGLFLVPMTEDLGWSRGVFALALAVQNLLWGAAQPFAGMLADRYGTRLVVAASGALYAAGVALMAVSTTPGAFVLTAGVMVGLALSGTAFGLVLAAIGKAAPAHLRSFALGIGSATGSAGQLLIPPLGTGLIIGFGWSGALLLLAACALLMLFGALALPGREAEADGPSRAAIMAQTLPAALKEAFAHRSYVLLTAGFFVCGWHVAFITVHLPADLLDQGLDASVATLAIMLIGGFNVIGSLMAGVIGGRYSKRYGLTAIYLLRGVAITFYLLTPPSLWTTVLFASAMGLLWLSTVPLTSGLVAQMFGTRYMATLFGIVFFSHQIGSFLGVWLGGALYDATGDYSAMWWSSVALSALAALLHWPIDERPVARLRTA